MRTERERDSGVKKERKNRTRMGNGESWRSCSHEERIEQNRAEQRERRKDEKAGCEEVSKDDRE